MGGWELEFSVAAEGDLATLDAETRQRVINKLDWFLENFDSLSPESLTGEYREFYKLRAGQWRIFYKINWQQKTITVHYIDPRDKAYRKR